MTVINIALPSDASPVSGKRFCFNHLPLVERARIGAEIYEQRRPVANLT
jgi:hypothetical protein